jgi:hypothetical protein
MPRMVLLLLAAAVLPVLLVVGAHAQSPTLTVTPSNGNQFQTFTIAGEGFTPGAAYAVTFLSPDGEEFGYYTSDGSGNVTADSGGQFTVTIVPAVDFAGARAGRWTVYACTSDYTTCWSREFVVSA